MQGDSVYLLDSDRLPSLLDAAGVQLRVFDAKPLYHIALEHGGVGAAIVFDGKLDAYLLNPSASDYQAGAAGGRIRYCPRLCLRRRAGCRGAFRLAGCAFH